MAQLADANFIEQISEALKETGLDPENLELEITETSFMENPQDTINKVNTLWNMGIFFSIDDFGIDYSSLGYVSKFKIKTLKIDRIFIKNIIDNEVNKEITKAIITMAHNLNLKVIAEGVETVEQKEFLNSLNCDEMQGFLFSKPLPADEFEKLLKKGIILHG